MIGAIKFTIHGQGSPEGLFRFGELAAVPKDLAEVAEVGRYLGMFLAVQLLVDLQGLPE